MSVPTPSASAGRGCSGGQTGIPPCDPPSDEEVAQAVGAALLRHGGVRGALLPVLQAVQAGLGYLPPGALKRIADGLNLSAAEVHGVVTFYRDFRTEPPRGRIVRICRAEACQALGADDLLAAVRERLGLAAGPRRTTPDGSFTLEEVFCLGNCTLGPSVQIDGALLGRMSAERLIAALAARS